MRHSSFHLLTPSSWFSDLSRDEATARLSEIHHELETARDVQSRFFPRRFPPLAGLDYCGDSQQAGEVGRNLFDFIPVDGSTLVAAVGDVAGKGIPAAIMMAGVQASIKNLAAVPSRTLPEVTDELNRITCEICPDNAYVTLFCAQVEPAQRKLHYVNAGQEPALLIRDGGDEVRRLDTTGTVLGLTPSATFRQRTISIEPGDMLVGFTEGVTERAVVETVRQHPDATASELVEEILLNAGSEMDDQTVVVVRYTGTLEQSLLMETSADLALTAA